MLTQIFTGRLTLEIITVVDVVVGVRRVPVRIAHGILVCKVLLRAPHLLRAVRILLRGERSCVLWDVHLIIGHEVVETRVLLVLEPGVGHTKVVVRMNTDGQLARNRIPRVLVHLPNGRVTVGHLSHLIVSAGGPQNLNLLTFGVGDNLAADIGLVSLIEHINAHVDHHVGVVDFFIWSETELLDAKCLTSSKARNSSHHLFNIRRLQSVVPGSAHVAIEFLNVFHSPSTVVCWDRARLPHRMNVTHVVDRRRRVRVERLDVGVDVLCGGQLFGYAVRLVVQRVVRTMTKGHTLQGRQHVKRTILPHGSLKKSLR